MTTPSQSQVESIIQKIPALANRNQRIMLQKSHFKHLTDFEFSILWHLPGLDIMCTPKTMEYVEKRREALNLKFDKNTSITKEEK